MSCGLTSSLTEMLQAARDDGREMLFEHEAFAVVESLGIPVVPHTFLGVSEDVASVDLDRFSGEWIIVKVISEAIQHRTDVGGVLRVRRTAQALSEAIRTTSRRLSGYPIAGFTVAQQVDVDNSLGGELLLGLHTTGDFGPVVTFGPGGIYAEYLAAHARPGEDVVILSPCAAVRRTAHAALGRLPLAQLVSFGWRGQAPRIDRRDLTRLIDRFLEFASAANAAGIAELEVNPLALTHAGPLALDALIRLSPEGAELSPTADRPLDKLEHLLRPRSLAIVGVSSRANPGRVILLNTLREGFDRERLYVVKPGVERIEGCRCFADVASLPERVDLMILAIEASAVPGLLTQVLESQKAESLIVIPGGLGERAGTETLATQIAGALRQSRQTSWRGPLVNGGNCLGIRSKPGRYNTLFIPEHKLPQPNAPVAPLALISQSGALAVSKVNKLGAIHPRYVISVGNQIDLTVGDYLTFLADDPAIDVFACYVEGFRPLDGLRWLEAAARITALGKHVILMRAGKTAAGSRAVASHTAAIAGDDRVTRSLAEQAGVVVADNLSDFEDLIRLFCMLGDRRVDGRRLGALSNAGFECVTFADNTDFHLEPFGRSTNSRIHAMLGETGLDRILDVRNPLDVSPMMGDEAFVRAAGLILQDTNVDVGVIGCVPLTGALDTLLPEPEGPAGALVEGLCRLKREHSKAWVAVVDAGPLYDPMARRLERGGVPTFRSADRALRLLADFCRARLAPR